MQIARMTGIAHDKICLIEKGTINTGVGNMAFLAEAFGITVKDLMDFEYEKCVLASL